jgi:gliding motility-associated GldM-like protein
MAGGQQSPRQKMINMMYLVLLALLAMNVTNEVLNAFHMVNEGLQTSNNSLTGKNNDIFTAFDKQMNLDATKAKPFYDRAMEAKKVSDSLYNLLARYKAEITTKAEPDTESGDLKRRDDLEIATKMFVEEGDGGDKRGKDLRKKIVDTREALLNLIDPQDRGQFHLPLRDSIPRNSENKSYPWEYAVFHNVPATAAVTIISKFQNDVISSEGIVIEYLIKKIGEKEFHFTDLQAKIIAPTSYVLDGEQYKADIFLAAFNASTEPEVFLGPIGGFKKNPDGTYDAVKNITTDLPPGFSGAAIKAEGGFGKYAAGAAGAGEKNYGGVIRVKDPATQHYTFYPFEGKYQTAPKAVVVSPTKMNVFYSGVPNPVDISVPGVSQNDVVASIEGGGGALTKDPANPASYIATVSMIGKCSVNVSAKISGKLTPMGSKEFRVKRIPNPVPMTTGDKEGGNIQAAVLKTQQGIKAMLKDFEFDAHFTVLSYKFILSQGGEISTDDATSSAFTPKMRALMEKAKSRNIIIIDDIKAIGPDKTPRKIGQLAFTIQ